MVVRNVANQTFKIDFIVFVLLLKFKNFDSRNSNFTEFYKRVSIKSPPNASHPPTLTLGARFRVLLRINLSLLKSLTKIYIVLSIIKDMI